MESIAAASDGATAAIVGATASSDGVDATSDRATAASDGDTAASDGATAASDGVTTISKCFERLPVPSMGLELNEQVLRGGALREPVFLNGQGFPCPTRERVLRGGNLRSPCILTGLIEEDGKMFFPLQKWNKALAMFLTGKPPSHSPLALVTIFADMQQLLNQHCLNYMDKIRKTLDEAGAPSEPTAAMGELVGDSCRAPSTGKRSHKGRKTSILPTYGIVDMTLGGKPWHPLCLLNPKAANVYIEAMAENFTKLFEVVYYQMVDNLSRPSTACTPSRKLRRRGSDPLAPKGTTADRMYYIEGKGWVNCVKPDMPTPGSGSGSSPTGNRRRRFLKVERIDVACIAAHSKHYPLHALATAATRKRKRATAATSKRVLSHDADEASNDDDPYA